MRAFTIRLLPGDDLQQKLIDFVKEKNLSSGEKLEKSDKSEKYGHIMGPYRNQPPDDVVESNNNFQRSSSLALAPWQKPNFEWQMQIWSKLTKDILKLFL